MPVSQTSKQVYNSEIKGTKEEGQDERVLKAIIEIGKPCTARMIQEKTGLEINCLSRSLNNLWNKKKVIENYFEARCPITNRKAAHYRVIPRENQLNIF